MEICTHFTWPFGSKIQVNAEGILFDVVGAMNTVALKTKWRKADGDQELRSKRRLIFLSALGLIDFSIITLYQTGIIRRLPDVPLRFFDSNQVNAAPSAYRFGAPDGAIGSLAYATTMVLACAGETKNGKNAKFTDLLLAGTVAGNAAGATYYLYEMAFKQKKACVYCLAGAAINFASVALVAPVFKRIVRSFS